MASSPKPSRQPQTIESDQEREVPPHIKPSSKQTRAEVKSTTPPISSLPNFCLGSSDKVDCGGGGGLREISIIKKDTKPMATNRQHIDKWSQRRIFALRRFIQKQNLQVNLDELAKTPPSNDPDAEMTPYRLVTADR